MFALILWIDTGEVSVVERLHLKRVGRGFKAPWKNEWFKVKIIAENGMYR